MPTVRRLHNEGNLTTTRLNTPSRIIVAGFGWYRAAAFANRWKKNSAAAGVWRKPLQRPMPKRQQRKYHISSCKCNTKEKRGGRATQKKGCTSGTKKNRNSLSYNLLVISAYLQHIVYPLPIKKKIFCASSSLDNKTRLANSSQTSSQHYQQDNESTD